MLEPIKFSYPKDGPIVQKYGGTSMGSAERIQNIAKRTKRFWDKDYRKMVIVVSAMSGETNKLLKLIESVNPNAKEQYRDLAAAAGEQVAVALLSAALQAEGLVAEPLLAYQLGIRTEDIFSRAKILSIERQPILKAWDEGKIPVVAGFQGVNSQLEITTIGRGGSDTSAVAVAVALDAKVCEINTDVNGVYEADPRVIPRAQLCQSLDFDVALEMASLGSKVLHPRCVELAAKFGIPLVVRNTFTPDESERTLIMAWDKAMEAPVVSGVTLDRSVCRAVVRFAPSDHVPIADLFEEIAQRGINVDVIVYDFAPAGGNHSVAFTISSTDLSATVDVLNTIKDHHPVLSKIVDGFDFEKSLAKVSIVGLGMSSHLGVASKLFSAFEKAKIGIRMISTSEIKVSCVLSEDCAEGAYQSAYDAFFS